MDFYCAIPDQRGKHWLTTTPPPPPPTTQGGRPWGETSLGGWYIKEKTGFEMCFPLWMSCHLHCLQMWVTLNGLLVFFQTKWLCWTMLLSQDKETRVQWPRLTPWRSHPGRLPAEYCWGSVRSAALCLAGGKQMDKLLTRAYILMYYCAQEDLTIAVWSSF